MKLIKDTIIQLLKVDEMYRENDNKLIARIWYNQLLNSGLKDASAVDLLSLLAEGKLTSPESIRRSRQKTQEELIELRGKNYKARQKESGRFKEEELGYSPSSSS